MIDITVWMKNFLQTLNETFGDRVWFVGLQGSYGRGEATETSDIDVVVILDELSTMDIQTYNTMLDTLPHRELICGFLSGKNEIMNWESSDLFQFCHDTTPIKGNIDEVMAVIDESAVNRAIKIGACNIYHGCVHNMLYEKSEDILRGLYKSASFVVQAIVFQQTGRYIKHQEELLTVARLNEQAIINTFLSLKKGGIVDFILMSDTLFDWAKQWISKNSQINLNLTKGVDFVDNETKGTVISVAKQWWLKVNTKPIRMGPLDGATFPHIIKVQYVVGEITYTKRKWIGAGKPVPAVGSNLTVLYCADNPSKAKVL